MVFYENQSTYNPQKTYGHIRKVSSAVSRRKSIEKSLKRDKVYQNEIPHKVTDYTSSERFPINVVFQDFENDYNGLLEWLENNHSDVFNKICNGNVQLFSTDKQKEAFHPTQKPVALMEYLIKTYTNEGELILDFTSGSGSSLVASDRLNRKAIGIDNGFCDNDKEYCGTNIKGLSWIDVSLLRLINSKEGEEQVVSNNLESYIYFQKKEIKRNAFSMLMAESKIRGTMY